MSTIVLPEFVTRRSLQKPLEEAATFTASARGSAGRGATAEPRYRIRFAEPSQGRTTRPQSEVRAEHPAAVAVTTNAAPAQRPVRQPADARAQRPAGRLTRRGRFVLRGLPLLTLASLIILGVFTLILPDHAQGAAEAGYESGISTVTVLHGDSLWNIAQEAAPERDTRDVIHHIMELNRLDGGEVIPGQQLQVPVYTAK